MRYSICRYLFVGSFYVFIILTIIGFSGLPGLSSRVNAISDQEILKLTNLERKKNNLSLLKWNGKLSSSAYDKAVDMCRNNYWSHTSLNGVTPWYYFEKENYDFTYAGENLAKEFSSSSEAMKAWMSSPKHKENILKSQFRDMGSATFTCKTGNRSVRLFVVHFGSTIY